MVYSLRLRDNIKSENFAYISIKHLLNFCGPFGTFDQTQHSTIT